MGHGPTPETKRPRYTHSSVGGRRLPFTRVFTQKLRVQLVGQEGPICRRHFPSSFLGSYFPLLTRRGTNTTTSVVACLDPHVLTHTVRRLWAIPDTGPMLSHDQCALRW